MFWAHYHIIGPVGMPNKKTCLDFKGVYLILGVCVFEYEVVGSM